MATKRIAPANSGVSYGDDACSIARDAKPKEGRLDKALTKLGGSGLRALLASASPASARAAAYTHYIACGLSQNAKPAHLCQKGRQKGAFFRSNRADVFYTSASSSRPRKTSAPPSRKQTGVLYVNKITSNIPGKHRVSWFVGANGSAPSSSPSPGSGAWHLGFDTATADTPSPRLRGRGAPRGLLGSPRGAGRSTPTRCLGEVERAVARRRRLG